MKAQLSVALLPLPAAGQQPKALQQQNTKQPPIEGTKAAAFINETSQQLNKVAKRSLNFHIHEELDRIYVQVIDEETNEVVREVPPEKILDLVAAMLKSVGLIIDRHI
ncbi:flagellar protein FlaG [Bacillus sp. FSL K6-6483]|jgi:flagellar protein FlaG|uniref:flagellar protein FlaG n=1 Tax=Shouchella clausii TaxID=79880 RepID=UPI000BA73E29|nr:flagellar protein FlaG [Shouchella clausii]MCM3313518.1 flagellar protein FlaG [Psychrobacillus sp. MER TA 17]MCZ1181867.1 flagellar biosynthesis protein FlaG [Shouchella clausii]PAE94782.1 hypothetical protein CHH70_07210 [Shouchella clausii]PAF09312.1 hypothetical protein CHH65_12345 [Shouchella clausii]